ncbi:ribonuclease E inhibitor RraB [Aliivibrio finisterrensis]|jgi:regulator of RNase E activity RraB|uniref:Regulator of ribonuclease activity B n=1 Tax=Aliivibrio finisterrensis TaxID=511998 RepID=A0A4Q5KK36_9GAMM|nr:MULTISPECIES: ribonuclease E inhibitor RraB [Aliivibrio]MCP3699483.1 ribonuclease E inhibitor RraB [Aliivibrio sp.]MDD9175529.1 ribonuclease E inhibitor RraB [Aliivibrio sp. S3TY1]MDD9177515.1 ribonuclease E inhibitor RraB [Aliivibrio sp. A6]MDD9192608.1 ribonuclease E inhibitor RraB [Aliivibrio sp. S2TY2]RYU46587.1 ribonuclease E inhibitor RraB [Aliivibrio finisterrensis]
MSQEDEYLSVEQFLELQKAETREIIESLKADGSEPDALYAIEHHLMAEDFKALENAVVEAFKMGFEVLEAEELEDEDGAKILCCDAVMDSALDADVIDAQVEKLVNLAEKHDIIYDGWGTYYEGEDAEYDVIEDGDED